MNRESEYQKGYWEGVKDARIWNQYDRNLEKVLKHLAIQHVGKDYVERYERNRRINHYFKLISASIQKFLNLFIRK